MQTKELCTLKFTSVCCYHRTKKWLLLNLWTQTCPKNLKNSSSSSSSYWLGNFVMFVLLEMITKIFLQRQALCHMKTNILCVAQLIWDHLLKWLKSTTWSLISMRVAVVIAMVCYHITGPKWGANQLPLRSYFLSKSALLLERGMSIETGSTNDGYTAVAAF